VGDTIMSFLPKIRECPQCGAINLLRINGIIYENVFKSLAEWTLKKIFYCRKCKIVVGFFIQNNIKRKEKLVWIDLLKCEENYYDHLSQLQEYKVKYKKQNERYYKIQKEISDIQNKIRLDQIKVIIKSKIQKRVMLI
jgi:hypothetical protein